MSLDTSQFRKGLRIELDGQPFVITYFQHVKPGKGPAFVRTKIKNLKSGRVLDRTFRAGEKVEEADVVDHTMQYLYRDADSFIFMDLESYDQLPFSSEQIGSATKFLKENLEVGVLFWRNDPIRLELPSFIVAKITECAPGLKGDTASGGTKPATIETGAVIQVPLFIKEGEIVRVDTRTGEYVERVN